MMPRQTIINYDVKKRHVVPNHSVIGTVNFFAGKIDIMKFTLIKAAAPLDIPHCLGASYIFTDKPYVSISIKIYLK